MYSKILKHTIKITLVVSLFLLMLFILREKTIWPFTEDNQYRAYSFNKFGTIKKDALIKSNDFQSFLHNFKVDKFVLDNQLAHFDIYSENNDEVIIYGISYRNSGGRWDKDLSLNKLTYFKKTNKIKTEQIKTLNNIEISRDFLILNETNFLYSYVIKNEQEDCRQLKVDLVNLEQDNVKNINNFYSTYCHNGPMHMVGGGLEKDQEGNIYLGVGDFNNPDLVLNKSYKLGKILKFNIKDETNEIFATGFRNPQGMTFSEFLGFLIESEHGPKGGDEINIVKKDRDYGWPLVSYGVPYALNLENYSKNKNSIFYHGSKKLYSYLTHEGFQKPVRTFVPDIGIKGIHVMPENNLNFPLWSNNLFITSAMGGSLVRIEFEDNKIINQELIYDDEKGRDISISPSGLIFISSTKGETLDIIYPDNI